MADNNRKDPRAKVLSMTVRFKSATLDEFIEHHSHDVSRGGMFIKTPQPFPPGTLLKFEVKIAADQKVMQGVGRVVWRRQADEASDTQPSGMGVKFIKLDEESKSMIGQLVGARAGDASAFDEVPAAAESAPTGASEPPVQPAPATGGNFFPTSDSVPPAAPEDRTVMKQAAELLQEALREVGSTSTGSVPPVSTRESVTAAQSSRLAATTPAPSSAAKVTTQSTARLGAVRASRVSMPSVSETKPTSTVPPEQAKPTTSKTPTPALAADWVPPTPPRATVEFAVESEARQPRIEAPAATPKPGSQAAATKQVVARSEPRGKAVSAAPVRAVPASRDDEKAFAAAQAQAPKASSGGGMRAVIWLVIIAALVVAIIKLTRKPEPLPAAPAEPSVVEKAPEPTPPPPVPSVEAPASAAAAVATGAATVTAPAVSAEPAKEAEPAKADVQAQPTKAEPKATTKSRPVAVRRKAAAGSDDTTPPQPEAPSDTSEPKPAAPEAPPKAASDSTPAAPASDNSAAGPAKGKTKAAGAGEDENPL